MSDWGGSQGWLSESELARAGCGKDCHCTNQTCRMARELRSLRTRPAEPQGLTAEDLGALRNARVCVANHGDGRRGVTHEECVRALAVLDRLLGCAEVRR